VGNKHPVPYVEGNFMMPAGRSRGEFVDSQSHSAFTSVAILSAARRIPRQAARGLVRIYRYTFSPLVGFHCRHLPTCSEFADEALARHGLWIGGWMILARILRCHPWGTAGLDFVPEAAPSRARWYLPWRYGRWRGVNDVAPSRSAPRG
jgi:putative membrane protein insertion efficiency factor